MPNHCSNRLTVSGKPEEVRKFVSFAKPDPGDEKCRDDQPLDYNKLCPMPDNPFNQLEEGEACCLNEFRKRLRGGAATPLEEYSQLKESDNPEDQRKAAHLADQAWYDWRVHNWKTKWNCYDGAVDESRVDSDGIVIYNFDSAWSPPSGVITAAAEKFNTLEFVLEYAEPGCDFSGVLTALGDVHDDVCHNSVLATDYGQELYQESFDEMAREEAEEERLKNAEDQDQSNA